MAEPNLDEILSQYIRQLVERADYYNYNNGYSILSTGDFTKWFLPEELEKLKQTIATKHPLVGRNGERI